MASQRDPGTWYQALNPDQKKRVETMIRGFYRAAMARRTLEQEAADEAKESTEPCSK